MSPEWKCPILLVDMNSYFASVHQALDKKLKHRPVIVHGNPLKRRGIVLAASYEAKAMGIKTGMTVAEARELCPGGIFILPDYPAYIRFSQHILRVLQRFTPLVEPYSIDEAFLDVRGCRKLYPSPLVLAETIKKQLQEELDLPCSIGIGPNKLLAKMAATMKKPKGITRIDYHDVPSLIWPLPVEKLFGVGPRLSRTLRLFNIQTIGDLAQFPPVILERRLGIIGRILHLHANGIDHTPVTPAPLPERKSIGCQITVGRDCCGHQEISTILWELAEKIAYRARREGYSGRRVALILRDSSFISLSRSLTLPEPTNLANEIYKAAYHLLINTWPSWRPVRLVGLRLEQITPGGWEESPLFSERERLYQLARACDQLRSRWGEKTIRRATSLLVNELM